MASSRASSPVDATEPGSPGPLTPRSKVKAMLAALDDNSDSEITQAIKETVFKPSNASLESQNKTTAANTKPTNNEDEEDDDDVVRPQGRLAVRMHLGSSDNVTETEQIEETARDRVRRMLLENNKSSPKPSPANEQEESDGSNQSPLVSRKRKLRAANDSPLGSSPSRENEHSPDGLFVSPSSVKSASPAPDAQQSDDDLPVNPNANSRFLALVEKARQERQAKEAEVVRKRVEKAKLATIRDALLDLDEDEGSDDDAERQLTQQVRPTRKASKKALEEMHKETQRLSRSMQLAHQARTKKKITKSSLFARFNYHPVGQIAESIGHDQSLGSSSPVRSDVGVHDTPPTSPLAHPENTVKAGVISIAGLANESTSVIASADNDEDIPSLEVVLAQDTLTKVDKGKGKAVDASPHAESPEAKKQGLRKRPIRNHHQMSHNLNYIDDSDSDLEIEGFRNTPRKMIKDSIFDRIPAKQAKEPHSLHVLRLLAQQASPRKQNMKTNAKSSMTASEMQTSLQQLARQQALREREERLQALRDRGIIVQTVEEREREMVEVENLIEKARREAQEIMKREKASAKKNKNINNDDEFGESEDEDWEEGGQTSEDGDDEHEALSGEDEDEDADEEEDDEINKGAKHPGADLIDEEASAGTSDEDDNHHSDGDEPEDPFVDDNELPIAKSRHRNKTRVISDDEDEDEVATAPQTAGRSYLDSPATHTSESIHAPSSVLRSATKTFIPGLPVTGPAGLSLSQIFAGTMDDSQLDEQSQTFSDLGGDVAQKVDEAQDSLAFLRNLPAPQLPEFKPTMDEDSQEMIKDSQTPVSRLPQSQSASYQSQALQLDFSQSEIHGFDSLVDDIPSTQLSEFPEPTQDAGFQDMTPVKGRFVEPPPSTIETVTQTPHLARISETPVLGTPVPKKKGRLQRRIHVADLSDDDDAVQQPQSPAYAAENGTGSHSNAFEILRKSSKRQAAIVDFDKKKSGAKDMVHEQAEESEDEYAGLGGNSDDESVGEEDAFVKEMIDDEGGQDVDERQLAAFFADKERAKDEKAVEKLFKDITNGTLRRKRGADYDLSDSDDDGEARRLRKQREFAKMRKALLEDERIGKIAENPKRLAFLRAIEDRDDNEGELDFLDNFAASQDPLESQSQSQAEDSQQDANEVTAVGPPKRKLSTSIVAENRLPPHLRRTKPSKKPSNLSEIREFLSSLIDEPNAAEAAAEDSSDSDLEVEGLDGARPTHERNKENRDPFASRRSSKTAVVDRISLKRASSHSAPASNTTRLAFASASSAGALGFKVPALLRRATTNSSLSSSVSNGSTTVSVSGTERLARGLGMDARAVTKKAGKNSGVNYFARENERRSKVQEAEKRREEKRFKGAEGRRKVVGGLFGMGKFE